MKSGRTISKILRATRDVFCVYLCLLLGASVLAASERSQDDKSGVFRCGNEYTNRPDPEQMSQCERLDDAVLSVIRIEGTQVYMSSDDVELDAPAIAAPTNRRGTSRRKTSAAKSTASAQPSPAPTTNNSSTQRKRERDAKMILQAELQKTAQRRTLVAAEYAKTKDTKLKTELSRLAADEAGLKRELSRLAP